MSRAYKLTYPPGWWRFRIQEGAELECVWCGVRLVEGEDACAEARRWCGEEGAKRAQSIGGVVACSSGCASKYHEHKDKGKANDTARGNDK